MAQSEHLPIYRDAFELLVYLENAVQTFSKYHKYTLGTDLRNSAREVLKLIVRANNSTAREVVLEELRLALEDLKVLIRVGKEVKAFPSFKTFEVAVNQLVSVSKQTEGWLRSTRQRSQGQKLALDRDSP